LLAHAPDEGRPGLAVTVAAFAMAAGSLALMPVLGIVAALCLAFVLALGGIGIGTRLQLERARGKHPDEAVDAVAVVLRVLLVFALVTPFWSLFDQERPELPLVERC